MEPVAGVSAVLGGYHATTMRDVLWPRAAFVSHYVRCLNAQEGGIITLVFLHISHGAVCVVQCLAAGKSRVPLI
jgi:hypothetical protein